MMAKDAVHALRVMIWHNDDSEDYTDAFTFLEETNPETPEVIWAKYLQYLRGWAESHKEPGFMGCCPACYEEWLGSEYAQEMEGR